MAIARDMVRDHPELLGLKQKAPAVEPTPEPLAATDPKAWADEQIKALEEYAHDTGLNLDQMNRLAKLARR